MSNYSNAHVVTYGNRPGNMSIVTCVKDRKFADGVTHKYVKCSDDGEWLTDQYISRGCDGEEYLYYVIIILIIVNMYCLKLEANNYYNKVIYLQNSSSESKSVVFVANECIMTSTIPQ